MSEKSKKVAVGAAVGAAAGFVAGILLAPKSGKETRSDLKNGATNAVKKADKQLKKVHDDLSRVVDKAEKEVHILGSKVKTEAVEALDKAKSSRDKAASVLAAVRSGNSADEDLDIAVKNANAALTSLKKYFSK